MEDFLTVFEHGSASNTTLSQLQELKVDALQYAKFIGIVIFGLLLISSMARFLLGKKAQINQAVTASVEIFFVYVIAVVIYALGLKLEIFIAPLPLVALTEDYLVFFPILSAEFTMLCDHLLHMLIIAFLVNLVNGWIPNGQHWLSWVILRFLTVVASIALIYGAELLLAMFVPQGLAEYAPTVLLCVLIALVLLGSLKLLVGAAMALSNPVIAALYTFFFSNYIGRALSKAILSTALLSGIIIVLNGLKIYAIHIAADVLGAYIPLLLMVFGLWILIGYVFGQEKEA